jgi:hypothetical protein
MSAPPQKYISACPLESHTLVAWPQVEITCEEHDRQAASTQFVTHTVGRMLGAMEVGAARFIVFYCVVLWRWVPHVSLCWQSCY